MTSYVNRGYAPEICSQSFTASEHSEREAILDRYEPQIATIEAIEDSRLRLEIGRALLEDLRRAGLPPKDRRQIEKRFGL